MNTPGFNQLSQQDQDRIDAYLDGSITPAEFDTLQERMVSDPALRAVMRRYLALDDSLRNEVGADGTAAASFSLPSDVVKNASPAPANVLRFPKFFQPLAWAAAIALLFALGRYFDLPPSHPQYR